MNALYKVILVLAVLGLIVPSAAIAARRECPVCPEQGKVLLDRDRDTLICSWHEEGRQNTLARGRAGQLDYVLKSVQQPRVRECAGTDAPTG